MNSSRSAGPRVASFMLAKCRSSPGSVSFHFLSRERKASAVEESMFVPLPICCSSSMICEHIENTAFCYKSINILRIQNDGHYKIVHVYPKSLQIESDLTGHIQLCLAKAWFKFETFILSFCRKPMVIEGSLWGID